MPLPPDILAALERRLRQHAGLELPSWVIEARALARMAALGLDAEHYLDRVSAPRGAELAALVEAVRVGETSFFRHRAQVDAVVDVVVPSWRHRGVRAPRVWSAGCATGEEPYTLALVLDALLPRPMFAPSILATDVSSDAIAVARRRRYPRVDLDRIPAAYRAGVEVDDEGLSIRPEVAQLVSFETRNLVDGDQPRGFDLVWCRNVLIYFSDDARLRAAQRLVAALAPGGYLFVGYSESLRDVAGLEAIAAGDAAVYRKAEAPRTPSLSPSPSPSPPPSPSPSPPPPPPPRPVASRPRSPSGRAAIISVHGHGDAATLTADIAAALRAPGLLYLTVDLDRADHLGDDVVAVLRRARAAATAAGIELQFVANRGGARRWLRRHRLVEDAT